MKCKRFPLSTIKKITGRPGVLFFSVFAFASMATASFAAPPSLFFSDLTDGPTTGWERSSSKGAAISIWGNNLGNSRGSSTVTVCGVTLNNDSDFAEWGATTNPTTARGLQRVTFWLNSSMTTGSSSGIRVTTPQGTSATIPFYCRDLGSNKIVFIDKGGSDSNNGLTTSSPWASASKVRSLNTGDIAYFRAGVWNAEDNWGNVIDFWSTNHANGVANKSIAMASYPTEVAQLGDGSIGSVLGHHGSTPDVLNYWTFSKFKMRARVNVTNWSVNQANSDDHLRFIANDMSTTGGSGKTILTFNGGSGGQTNLSVYGNYLCDGGSDSRGEVAPLRAYGLYFGGYGWHDNIDIGWNEIAYNSHGRGIQIYGHTVDDWIDNLYIHDNYIHHNSMTGVILSGGDGSGGSYNYEFVKNAWFYNNIVSENGDNTPAEGSGSTYGAILIGGVGWGGNGGNYYIYNNTIYNNMKDAFDITGSPRSVTIKNNIVYNKTGQSYLERGSSCPECTASNNIYYNGSGHPAWDASSNEEDPLFVSASPVSYVDFQLQGTSPAANSGTDISLVTRDFNGIARPQDLIMDIGAYEFPSVTIDLSAPLAPSIRRIVKGP